VREALRALAEKGLITKTPGARGGSFVQYVDHHVVSQVLSERLMSTMELGSISYGEVADFRNLLEIPSARLAAERRTEENLEELRR
jgi:DNA-binding FadR family transcriptional regulator